ncbi:MAG: Lrp/AsnC ligand binding domain-containing protein [Nitrososphaerales archaeon]
MPSAYVLINCDLGSENSIMKEITGLDGVKKVEQVQGVYDLIISVESDSMERLKEAITWKIRRMPKVRSTVSLIVLET